MRSAKISDWVPRNQDVDISKKPVHLSDEDKHLIVNMVGFLVINGPCEKANRELRVNLAIEISRQLGKVVIVPSIFAIELLIREISQKYERALAEDGYAAGLIAATSIASASTQSTMDSFKMKSGGSMTVEGGVVGLATLIYTRLARRTDAKMIIHFNTFITKQDVIDMRAVLVELKASELVVNYQIGKLAVTRGHSGINLLERFWWHDLHLRNPDKRHFRSMSPDTHVLRLYLDQGMMYAHRITTRQVADEISNVKGEGIFTLYGPFSSGIVDIIIIPENNYINPRIESEQMTLLRQTVYQKLNDVTIKGISGVTNMTPKELKLTNLIISEERLIELEDSLNRVYKVTVGNTYPKVHEALFPPYHRLESLFTQSGIKIRKRILDSFAKNILGYEVESSDLPSKLISNARENNYVYAISTGSNFDAILKLPWVDPLRSTPNDIFEIAAKIGIEASREYFLYELQLVLESIKSKDINSRHITLLADVIFSQGKPAGTTSNGNIARNHGTLSLMSCEKGGTVATKAAINKESEKLTNTTPALVVGAQVATGRRARIIEPTAKTIEELRQVVAKKKDKKEIILRDTQGIRLTVRHNNQRLRESLMRKNAPHITAGINTPEVRIEITTPDTEIIDLVDNPEVTRINYLPVIVSEATKSIITASPASMESSKTPMVFMSTTEVPSDIRSTVTTPKLHSLNFYAELFAPKFNFTIGEGNSRFGILPKILDNYSPKVRERISRPVAEPKPLTGVNIYQGRDSGLSAPKPVVPTVRMIEPSDKIYIGKYIPYPTAHRDYISYDTTPGLSALDTILLPNLQSIIDTLRMPA